MQPLMTTGAPPVPGSSRSSSISAIALRLSSSSFSRDTPTRSAQIGLARQVGLSSTKPAPLSLASAR